MHHHCPDCAQPLPRRALLLQAVLRCEHCGATLGFGSFSQWLGAGLIGLAVALGLLFLQADMPLDLGLPAIVALSLLALLCAVALLVQPTRTCAKAVASAGGPGR